MPIPTVIEMIIGVGAEHQNSSKLNQNSNRCKRSHHQPLCGQ